MASAGPPTASIGAAAGGAAGGSAAVGTSTGSASVVVTQGQSEGGVAAGVQSSGVIDAVTVQLLSPRKKAKKKKAVQWAEDVVDNEHMGKKSSKKCCIFHKRRKFGDWSDSDTDDEGCHKHCHSD